MKKIAIALFCIIFSINLQAQKTRINSAKTWQTISSLMGVTFEAAQSTLKTNGMKATSPMKDEKSGQTYYQFIPEKSTDPEYETQYVLICLANKVVAIGIQYAYESSDEDPMLKADRQKMVDDFTAAGFVLNGEKSVNSTMAFDHKSLGYLIELRTDMDMSFFSLAIGADKYIAIFRGND